MLDVINALKEQYGFTQFRLFSRRIELRTPNPPKPELKLTLPLGNNILLLLHGVTFSSSNANGVTPNTATLATRSDIDNVNLNFDWLDAAVPAAGRTVDSIVYLPIQQVHRKNVTFTLTWDVGTVFAYIDGWELQYLPIPDKIYRS
jgi:hypothetical protein